MKRLQLLFAICLACVGGQPSTDADSRTFYLQLIRGNDEDKPPLPNAGPIGLKLHAKLHSVCKWKYYWELNRIAVVIKPGQKVRRRMSPEREIEIELWDSQRMAARIFLNGQLVQSRTQPAEAAFLITGGDKGENQSWFIVVRRDKPLDPES